MYHGEVNVAQEDLNSFLTVAEDLEVKGLTQNNSKSKATSKAKPSTDPIAVPHGQHQRSLTTSTPEVQQLSRESLETEEIQEIIPVPVVKSEPYPVVSNANTCASDTYTVNERSIVGTSGSNVVNYEENFPEDRYEEYSNYEDQGYGEYESAGYSAEGGEIVPM